jgi:hypothetical protein
MHLLSRVPGLLAEQCWRLPLLDPGLAGMSLTELEARVRLELLDWENHPVPCYKIEYRTPGEQEVRASTWVRQRDGLVLQQDAGFGGREFEIVRVPPR